MTLVPSCLALLQPLAVVMTAPSFANFTTILAGWGFAPRRTVTGMIVASGMAGLCHHSIFHRFFARARWSLDTLGLAVFALIEPWLDDGPVLLALDDTPARKRGRKTFGVGMHHDPLLSTRKTTVVNWGHNWVVLAVIVRFPFCKRRCFCLPVAGPVPHVLEQKRGGQGATRLPQPTGAGGADAPCPLRIPQKPAFPCHRGQRVRRSERAQ